MVTMIHAVIGYLFLLLVVRVLTRRPGAQMSPFEFVLIFLIGGVIILTTVGNDRSETNAVCAVIAVALMHRLLFHFKLISSTFDARRCTFSAAEKRAVASRGHGPSARAGHRRDGGISIVKKDED